MRRWIGISLAAVLLASASMAAIGTSAGAAEPYEGSVWSEHYFPMGDTLMTTLHADVLRPKHVGDKKTPVILTVSPYLNHTGTPTQPEPHEYDPAKEGPSPRFYDFLEVTDIIKKGYTYVMVDLPGFGGSSGCNDWGGPQEQMAVKAAVEWAASQDWSTGKVGLMGKSYDAWTGLMGMAQKPKGLAAVVAMEPVYSGYRYGYMNGVRFSNSVLTPALFQAFDAQPGSLNDDPMYVANGAPQAYCYGVNMAMQQQDEESSAFWAERNLLEHTKGSKVPLFLTQGFIESNTKPDGAFDLFNALKGPNRAWFGQFDHWRGWEKNASGDYYTGRSTFAKEIMRFLDQYVKGVNTTVEKDPNVAVQDVLGRYRGESSWPPADAKIQWSKLRAGEYEDDRTNGRQTGTGLWTISQPLPYDVWMAGEPVIELTADAVPRSNAAVNVFDIAPNGTALMLSRGTMMFRGAGAQEIKFEMYGQDAPIAKGHRIGVIVSGFDGWFDVDIPTNQTITVAEGRVGIPFLTFNRTKFLDGESTPDLQSFRAGTISLSKDTIKEAQTKFSLPPKLRKR